jgi:crotonobetainyl-CoA:carnitine CoA-transferase CaiB-like acyl-CoA transferase
MDNLVSLTQFMFMAKERGVLWVEEQGKNALDGGAPYYNVYESSDKKYFSVGCLEPKFFKTFVNVRLLTVNYLAIAYRRCGEEGTDKELVKQEKMGSYVGET